MRCVKWAVKNRGNILCHAEKTRSTSVVQPLHRSRNGQVDVAFKVQWEGGEFECTGHQLKVKKYPLQPEIALLLIKEQSSVKLVLSAAAFEICVCVRVCARARGNPSSY